MVQIAGVLRNIANRNDMMEEFYQNRVAGKLMTCLLEFRGHRELVYNVSRILSKLSVDGKQLDEMTRADQYGIFYDLVLQYNGDSEEELNIMTRFAFVLGNLTTMFEEPKQKLALQIFPNFEALLELTASKLSHEDTASKLIRLIANLSTDEDNA